MTVNAMALVAVDRHLHGFVNDRDAAIAGMSAGDRATLVTQLKELVALLGSTCGDCGKLVDPRSGYSKAGPDHPTTTYHSVCGPDPGPWDDAWYEAHPESGD